MELKEYEKVLRADYLRWEGRFRVWTILGKMRRSDALKCLHKASIELKQSIWTDAVWDEAQRLSEYIS